LSFYFHRVKKESRNTEEEKQKRQLKIQIWKLDQFIHIICKNLAERIVIFITFTPLLEDLTQLQNKRNIKHII